VFSLRAYDFPLPVLGSVPKLRCLLDIGFFPVFKILPMDPFFFLDSPPSPPPLLSFSPHLFVGKDLIQLFLSGTRTQSLRHKLFLECFFALCFYTTPLSDSFSVSATLPLLFQIFLPLPSLPPANPILVSLFALFFCGLTNGFRVDFHFLRTECCPPSGLSLCHFLPSS